MDFGSIIEPQKEKGFAVEDSFSPKVEVKKEIVVEGLGLEEKGALSNNIVCDILEKPSVSKFDLNGELFASEKEAQIYHKKVLEANRDDDYLASNVPPSTLTTYKTQALKFFNFLQLRVDLSAEERRILNKWDPSKHVAFPFVLGRDKLLAAFLQDRYVDFEKKNLKVYPEVRKTHAYISNSFDFHNVDGFETIKGKRLRWPCVQKLWKKMKKSSHFRNYSPVENNCRPVTVEENLILDQRVVDLNCPKSVQAQLVIRLNLSNACRPATLRRLNFHLTKIHENFESSLSRPRGEIVAVVLKANQNGFAGKMIADQSFKVVCDCELGTGHDRNSPHSGCPVHLLELQLENLKKEEVRLQEERKFLKEKIENAKTKEKQPKSLVSWEKRYLIVCDCLSRYTHTSLIRTPRYSSKKDGKNCVGFKCSPAHSELDYIQKVVSETLGRPFKYYDGRKSACNILLDEDLNGELKVKEDLVAKTITHNDTKTMKKFYLRQKSKTSFKALEAFSLIKKRVDMGLNKQKEATFFAKEKKRLIEIKKARLIELKQKRDQLQQIVSKKTKFEKEKVPIGQPCQPSKKEDPQRPSPKQVKKTEQNVQFESYDPSQCLSQNSLVKNNVYVSPTKIEQESGSEEEDFPFSEKETVSSLPSGCATMPPPPPPLPSRKRKILAICPPPKRRRLSDEEESRLFQQQQSFLQLMVKQQEKFQEKVLNN